MQDDTWCLIKRIPNYKQDFGVALFKRMFEVAPDVWKSFPWGHGVAKGEDMSIKNEQFVVFATRFVAMLDMAVDMLGPDLDMAEMQLQQLGVSHIDYGVMPKHYPLMGRALIDTLEAKLGDAFTIQHKDSWNTVYTFMSVSMMQGAFADMKNQKD